MNNARRKEIKAVAMKLDELRATFESLIEEIDRIKEAEEEARDNLPENQQDGERAEKMTAAADALETARDTIETWDIDEVISSLSTAEE